MFEENPLCFRGGRHEFEPPNGSAQPLAERSGASRLQRGGATRSLETIRKYRRMSGKEQDVL